MLLVLVAGGKAVELYVYVGGSCPTTKWFIYLKLKWLKIDPPRYIQHKHTPAPMRRRTVLHVQHPLCISFVCLNVSMCI